MIILRDYKITFTSSDHHEERIFIVVADPENYVPDTLPFTIMSDKQTYNVGDHITFTGVINEAKDDITQGQVVITMTDPGGNKLTTASAKSGVKSYLASAMFDGCRRIASVTHVPRST